MTPLEEFQKNVDMVFDELSAKLDEAVKPVLDSIRIAKEALEQ